MDRASIELRYEIFAKEYLTNGFDASKAARAAGYSEQRANQAGNTLLNKPEVMALIKQDKAKVIKKLSIDHNKITKELENIAFGSAADMFNDWTDLKNFNKLTDEQKRYISEIDTKTVTDKGGNKTDYVRIKFHDKANALKLLGQHSGYFEGQQQQQVQNIQINISSEELMEKLNKE